MKNKKIYLICVVAIMAAMSIVLDKVGTIKLAKEIKITFYALPLIVVGVIHGPLIGAITGIITGTVIQLTSEWGISLASPFYALAPIVWGLVSGLTFKMFRNKKRLGFVLTVVISSICANLINTFAFFMDSLLIKDSTFTTTVILSTWPMRLLTMLITMIPYIVISSIVCDRVMHFLDNKEMNEEQDNNY